MGTLNAYQQTYALKAALELELFTHIASGADTPPLLAQRVQASERGVRILCDYLVVIGLLTKFDGRYGVAPDTAPFVDSRSPAYLGRSAGFLVHDQVVDAFRDLARVVRTGDLGHDGTVGPDEPIWVEFARAMAPMVRAQAQRLAELVTESGPPSHVLDIAAGHGVFGLEIAARNPAARIVAVDWTGVLEVARENAAAYGVAERYRTVAGSAFDVDFGTGYDLVLLPNFLHHFDHPTNVRLLQKIRSAMTPDGLVATVEFVPNDDRVTPPMAAGFALTMLSSTPAGDAYTFRELDEMFHEAGFGESRLVALEPTPQHAVLTRR